MRLISGPPPFSKPNWARVAPAAATPPFLVESKPSQRHWHDWTQFQAKEICHLIPYDSPDYLIFVLEVSGVIPTLKYSGFKRVLLAVFSCPGFARYEGRPCVLLTSYR